MDYENLYVTYNLLIERFRHDFVVHTIELVNLEHINEHYRFNEVNSWPLELLIHRWLAISGGGSSFST